MQANHPLFLGFLCISTLAISTSKATTPPLLGSTQSIVSSPFCKKYKCLPLNSNQSRGFYLYLPEDYTLAELQKAGMVKDISDITSLNKYRTFVDFRFDKKKQFLFAEFQLTDTFYSSRGPSQSESAMIYDFYKMATGISLPRGLGKSMGAPGSEDIYRCIEGAKASKTQSAVYQRSKIFLTVNKAYGESILECYTGLHKVKGYYNPVISIGFTDMYDDFISDNVYY